MAKSPTTRAAVVPILGEAFREYGYEGASMAVLQQATGLGRGSLYNFFPGGKQEMAQAVLEDIDHWFEEHIFDPLRRAATLDAEAARSTIGEMFCNVDDYFRSGRRVCLPGAFAVSRERDRFANAVAGYFSQWVAALCGALRTCGLIDPRGGALRVLAAIQGGIVVARALDDQQAFNEALAGAKAATLVA